MWNPFLESLPLVKLREIQLRKVKRIINWAWLNSPFYREKLDRSGVVPKDIQTLDDLRSIPLTKKSEWLESQGSNTWGFGTNLAVPESDLIRYHQTSGTTGKPVRLAFSTRDWNSWLECWGYGLSACNLTAKDRVLVCFPFNLFVGWWGGQDAARLLGCRVYSGGGMSTGDRLKVIREHRITTLMGAPSYLLRMGLHTGSKGEFNARVLGVKKLICGAEPGGSIPSMRKRLEETWNAEVFDHLGASEVGPWGYECSFHPGGVHICESFFFLEFLDPETLKPARAGELSRVVITALEKFAQPVIRWDLKDLVRVSKSSCPCGRSFRWLEGGILGRTDDLIKIRGVLLSPRAIEDVVQTFDKILDYRVVISEIRGMDELTIHVGTRLLDIARDFLFQELEMALKERTHLRFKAQLLEEETLSKNEIKIRRVKDLRKEGERNCD